MVITNKDKKHDGIIAIKICSLFHGICPEGRLLIPSLSSMQ
jgi:hypothetical protein